MAVEEGPDQLDIAPEARIERLTRRVAALERQVEARIGQVDDLQRRLRHAENLDGASQQEMAAAKAKAAEYDALMATFTMRALRLPRAAYAVVRKVAAGRRR